MHTLRGKTPPELTVLEFRGNGLSADGKNNIHVASEHFVGLLSREIGVLLNLSIGKV
jgi:hypothetical protein